jgi:hypothetical protein
MRIRWRSMVTLGTVLAVVAVAASRGIASAESEPAPRFTASEIVDAVVFNTGPAARYLTFPRSATQWTDVMLELRQRVQLAMGADKNLTTTLADQMQSGDPVLVDEGLARISDKVRVALDVMYGADNVDEAMTRWEKFFSKVDLLADARVLDHELNLDNAQGQAFDEDKAIYIQTYLVVDEIVEAYRYVQVWEAVQVIQYLTVFFLPFGEESQYSDNTKLVRELVVRDIATGLHAPGR